jgi:CO/xanthine dehydrogenase FAD-binding subunit
VLAGDEDARIIAGGQTLIPMLAMRLARPSRLVDVLRLTELRGIRAEDDAIVIGAATRQVEVERNESVQRGLPLLARALPWVGHPPTRNRGTVGGSIANADPSAEIPLIAVTLGADIEIANASGRTGLPADEFFIGPMLTPHVGTGFHEVSARQSDFALVAAAAQVAIDEAGRCLDATLGLGGLGDRALRIDVTPLIGEEAGHVSIPDIVRAATEDLEVSSDLHATADYRRRVASVLGIRALQDAFADARSRSGAIQ